ncbi:MAG: GWxTD domain-containing protein [Caldithrix sp.]|nr:MAG: GWxTD domain-containing protein [Caldithrix sp.]
MPHGRYTTKVDFTAGAVSTTVESAFNMYIDGVPLSFTSLEEAIEVLKYIASEEEFKKLQKSPKAQKQDAFIEFWKKHDPTPETPENEQRREYYRRIQFANKNFHRLNKPGWKTDMGWVYVLLGAPDSIERNPFNQNFANRPGKTIKAIVSWTYYEYNKRFVFLDELGFGDFRLENRNTMFDLIN